MQCEYYALEGLSDLVGTIKRGARAPESAARNRRPAAHDVRPAQHARAAGLGSSWSSTSATRSIARVIPRNVRLAEAPSYGAPALHLGQGLQGRAGLPRARRRDAARIRVESASRMNKPKGLGRGLDALLGGGDEARARTALATLAGRSRSGPASTSRARAWTSRRSPSSPHRSGRRADAADPGAAGRRRTASRSSPASAAGAPRSIAGLERSAGAGARSAGQGRAGDGADREHPARGPESARGSAAACSA